MLVDSGGRRAAVTVVLGLGLVLFTSTLTMVNVALPTLARDFNVDLPVVQWVALAYFIANTSLLLAAGRIADIIGHRLVYLAGMLIFAAASLGAAASGEIAWLIFWRVVQAVGASAALATGTALLVHVYPGSQRGRAMGYFGVSGALGSALGPWVGGSVLQIADWPVLFVIMAFLAIINFAGSIYVIPRMGGSGERGFDWSGSILMAMWIGPGILALNYGMREGWGNVVTLMSTGTVVLALTAFVFRERGARVPLINLALFRSFDFSSGVFISVVGFAVGSCLTLLGPFIFENALGYSVADAGILLSISFGISVLVSAPAGYWTDHVGPHIPRTAGLLITMVGVGALAFIDIGWSPVHIGVVLGIFGIGQSLWSAPNRSMIMGSVARNQLGIAGGMLTAARQLGFASGQALFGGIFSGVVLGRTGEEFVIHASLDAQLIGFRLALVVAAVALMLTVGLSMRGRKFDVE